MWGTLKASLGDTIWIVTADTIRQCEECLQMVHTKLSKSICWKPGKSMRHLAKTKLPRDYYQSDQALTKRWLKGFWERRTVTRGKDLGNRAAVKVGDFCLHLMKQPPCLNCNLNHLRGWLFRVQLSRTPTSPRPVWPCQGFSQHVVSELWRVTKML